MGPTNTQGVALGYDRFALSGLDAADPILASGRPDSTEGFPLSRK